MSPSPAALKMVLRAELRVRLAALDPAERSALSRTITRKALALPELVAARGVFTCLSFGAEVDTWPLVDELLAGGKRVFVPRVERGERAIHVHPYPAPLHTLPFGLRQPLAQAAGGNAELAAEEVNEHLDVALILGLGFDRDGYRLGYGGGYFDRFLAARPFPAVGLAYDCQLGEDLPLESHDVPMRLLVTEHEILRPS